MAEFRDPDKLALELDKHEFSPVVRHSDHIDDPLVSSEISEQLFRS